MSGHVEPERWAALAQGRVGAAEEARLEAHAAACPRCQRQRARVTGTRTTLREIAAAEPPSQGWDLLGARLYWTAASEKRRRDRESTQKMRVARPRLLVPIAALCGGLGVIVLAAWGVTRREPLGVAGIEVARVAPPLVTIPFTLVDPQPPRALAGRVTLLDGDVRVAGEPLGVDAVVLPGARLETGRGRAAVQFAPGSVFVVEPGSQVALVRFDDRHVELDVARGAVTLEVAPRRPGQSLTVRAAGRAVEVKGTLFRVAAPADRLQVAVAHGRVRIDDATEVGAGSRLDGKTVRPLEAQTGTELENRTRLAVLPEGPDGLLVVSAPLGSRVRIDGIPSDPLAGELRVRTNPGRHLVEWNGGRRWVSLEAGGSASIEGNRAHSERPAQVEAQLRAQRSRLAECAERARKLAPGATGTLVVEIGIHEGGEIDFVSALPGKADPDFEQCVVDLIRDHFIFPAGTPGTVQKRITF